MREGGDGQVPGLGYSGGRRECGEGNIATPAKYHGNYAMHLGAVGSLKSPFHGTKTRNENRTT